MGVGIYSRNDHNNVIEENTENDILQTINHRNLMDDQVDLAQY